ncbi:MAG: alpha/beta fold hydrolase [Filimonas sp.]|nr:alpha/beta fold hydrolase [Filimonas sp.]
MKQTVVFLLLLSTCMSCHSQDFSGDWSGSADVMGNKLRAVFHIKKESAGYTATFDSPDQGAFGLPTSKVTAKEDSLIIDMPLLGATYYGKLNSQQQIEGALVQRATPFKLTLEKKALAQAAPEIKPQTPKPPFDYIIEEVGYENNTQHLHLGGTLTKPKGNGKFPAVILITGSGQQDRDETIGTHKPFWVIADYLTKAGIAVLRVDDRGVGKTTGTAKNATSADFATDVMAGIAYLKTRPDIDVRHIGLIGHSEGGMIAPYVAARSKDVAFIITLAGPIVGGTKTMQYQAVFKPMKLNGIKDEYAMAYNKLYTALLNTLTTADSTQKTQDIVKKIYYEWKPKQTPDALQVLVHGTDEEAVTGMTQGFEVMRLPWFRFFIQYDPAKDVERLQIPVLVLNGEKDIQVDPKTNLQLADSLLKANGNRHYKVYEVPGVNHLFQHCTKCNTGIPEYLQLEETFDPATLSMMSDWIKNITK